MDGLYTSPEPLCAFSPIRVGNAVENIRVAITEWSVSDGNHHIQAFRGCSRLQSSLDGVEWELKNFS